MADKAIKAIIAEILKGNGWEKFIKPSARGKTAYPKAARDQERLGIRFDYDRIVTYNGVECHLFKMQANAGKIPSSIKTWRDENGTDAVMARVYVKKDGTREDVKGALDMARESFRNA